MTNSASRAFLLTAAIFLMAGSAHAGKTDMQTLNVAAPEGSKPASMSNADFREIESAGMYKNANEGSLGKDLWKGSKRSVLLPLIEDMPVASREPAVQRLIFGALLTQADARMIENDVPIEPGRDLFTLRLEKLIQAGAYRQAQDFYSSFFEETKPYHERLARAGLLAMLLNGEKSLACVEANTLKDNFPESEFIKQALAFCDVTLSETPSAASLETMKALNLGSLDILTAKDAAIVYNPENFGALSLIEKAFLAAAHKISFEKSGITDIRSVPPTHLRILLSDDSLSEKSRFLLTVAAESWGLATPGELKDAYRAALPPAGGDLSSLQIPDTAEDWEKISYNFAIATNTDDESSRWNAIKNALALSDKLGPAALKPFADIIEKTQPVAVTEMEIEQALRVLNFAQKPIPGLWLKEIEQLPLDQQKTVKNQTTYTEKFISEFVKKDGKPENSSAELLKASPYESGSRQNYLLKNIIENVDNATGNSDNAAEIYEKDFGLTFKQDYVMPTIVVWNHLLEAGQSGRIGETVVLGASVLQVSEPENIYPGLFNDVRTSLSNVGLTEISSNLAIAAMLGTIQRN